MNSLVLCGLALSLALVVCDAKICLPDKFEAIEAVFGTGFHNKKDPGTHNALFYDAVNQMEAKHVYHSDCMSLDLKYTVLVRYSGNAGKAYVVDARSETCKIFKVPHAFEKICLPEDAKSLSGYAVGPTSAGLDVTPFVSKQGHGYSYFAAVVKGEEMMPVYSKAFGPEFDGALVETRDFANAKASITNSSVFDIPKQCEEPMIIEELKEMVFDRTIFAF